MIQVLFIFNFLSDLFKDNEINYNFNFLDNQIDVIITNFKEEYDEYQKYISDGFNGENRSVIIKKINRYLNSSLKGKGKFIVDYSLKIGMDPYLATAVILQETGCYWKCSSLTRNCNNVGGNKGKPSCNNGSYKRFSSLEEGIKFAINKLNSYYKKGYKTAKEINPFYAQDKTWYKKVNNYIKKLKK